MKRTELSENLRKAYTKKRGYGVLLGTEKGWENICFVVPPPPPIELKESLPIKVLAEANTKLASLASFTEMSELEKLINYLFIRREAVQSSRMEGNMVYN